MTIHIRRREFIITFGSAAAACVLLQAQSLVGSWPEHTVRIITPFSPGISVDVAARALGDALAKRGKQPVVVKNRPGADTIMLGAVQADKIKLLAVTNAVRTPSCAQCSDRC